jgi:hypothetical protein
MGALSAAVQRLAGAFNPQGLANTIWAYARLGVTPSASVMGALSDAVQRLAGAFTPKDLAMTLWAYTKLGLKPPAMGAAR